MGSTFHWRTEKCCRRSGRSLWIRKLKGTNEIKLLQAVYPLSCKNATLMRKIFKVNLDRWWTLDSSKVQNDDVCENKITVFFDKKVLFTWNVILLVSAMLLIMTQKWCKIKAVFIDGSFPESSINKQVPTLCNKIV